MFREAGKALARVADAVADFAYPRICPICKGKSDRARRCICWNCVAELKRHAFAGTPCSICGSPIDARLIDGLCASCRRSKPHFDMARSALAYDAEARNVVHDFKYRRQTWLSADMADILEGCARASFNLNEVDCIIPVPLHPVKFVRRTYNQSAILAASLAKRVGARYSGQILRREKDTPTQTHLGAGGRKKNVAGAFGVAYPEEVRSRTLLVIDDVMTTGATLDEVAKALKKEGAWRVWALTLCRASVV